MAVGGMMLTFITDRRNESEPDLLTNNRQNTLLIVSLEGQWLAQFEPPATGWTHQALNELVPSFPLEWDFCGADALLCEKWIGSTEV